MMNLRTTQTIGAAFLSLAVLAGACGSDAQSSSDPLTTAPSDGLFPSGGGAVVDDEDAEAPLVRAPADREQDEAMRDETSTGRTSDTGSLDADGQLSAPATNPARSASSANADSSVEGGLFAEEVIEPEPEPIPPRDDRFTDNGVRNFVATDDDPLSTFALDVDTGSYRIGQRFLDEGSLPPAASVRVEEYLNAFDYDYDEPRSGLDISVDGGPSPFDEDNYLVRIGVQAEVVANRQRPDAHLTFVIDTSGSMDRPDRLGLVKDSLAVLVDELDGGDTVALVIYSDGAGVVLPPTSIDDKDEILDAINALQPGGSTNLESGLRTGYELARETLERGDINRVILASDGVANVGTTDPDALARLIREDADAGIQLVTVGYGMGSFNDTTMEQLADQGDGFYAYVNTLDEAERLFDEELVSTLLTVAIDGKIQVEFDDRVVDSYRLLGYENRAVLDRDFRNDAVDAGELGAGHQVTALYEIVLARGVSIDDIGRDDIGVVQLRWQDPEDGEVIEIDHDIDGRDIEARWTATAADFRLATVVAAAAEVLRESPFADDIDLGQLVAEAEVLADDFRSESVDELLLMLQRADELR